MNSHRSGILGTRSNRLRALALACAAGFLAFGFDSSAWAILDGQGGAGGNSGKGGTGGASSAGGGGGGNGGYNGSAGVGGTGGNGGPGAAAGSGGGGSGGSAGFAAPPGASIVVTTNTSGAIGATGGAGGAPPTGNGGGGGGGGDGVYALDGIVTVNSGVTVTGGSGGAGGGSFLSTAYGGGGGGGGGNGVNFGQSVGRTLYNYGTISGGSGGSGATKYAGGGGGGHGVVGSEISIINSGTISNGSAGTSASGAGAATAGAAILFSGVGYDNLELVSGSTISGDIEVDDTATAQIFTRSGAQTLSSNIVLDGSGTAVHFATFGGSLTVTSVISGAGHMQVSSINGPPVTLTNANTFTGGSSVSLSGALQVDGSIGNVTVDGTGVLVGSGTVGNIVMNSASVIEPGGSPGTLHGGNLLWNGGGAFDFDLGATNATTDTDLLALSGTLSKGSAGSYVFHFFDGNGTPTLGVTYTLIAFGGSSGFSASDFTFDYTGANAALSGTFTLTPTALLFTPSDRIFADGFE